MPERFISSETMVFPDTRLRRSLRSIANRLLPMHCALCGSSSPHLLCTVCAGTLVNTDIARCRCCGIRLDTHESAEQCGACLVSPPAFSETCVVTDYAPPFDALVQALKFRAQLPLATAFAQLLIAVAPAQHQHADAILPVPLYRERLASRGFNQSLEIARPIARAWKMPLITTACVRVRDTQAQASLPLAQRRVNMRGAFALQERAAIASKHILLVDDVMTTGHTLNELGACLIRHGAARVSNLVLARTPIG